MSTTVLPIGGGKRKSIGPSDSECSRSVAELIKQPATVVEGFKIKVSLGDLLRLELNQKLNDNILNFYMQVDCVYCVC